MQYTQQDVMDYLREEDVKFIRLVFCDALGVVKNISIMESELPRAFANGISFDASAIRGFSQEERSDLFLLPDPSTLALLPWHPAQGRVVRMFCDVKSPGGDAYALDTRFLLKRAVEDAAQAGVCCDIGAEFEFYLFRTDANGAPTDTPIDQAGYMDMAPEDAGEIVRREICLTLEEMGIRPETSHHEEGPGQNEIDFRFSDPVSAADNAVTVKTVIKTIAARNGLYASFEPKPLARHAGSGMHINISPQGDCFQAFMAGILEHVSELTIFFNPTVKSYERLGGYKAPRYITWSPENRTPLIRIPAAEDARRRIELRSPDAMANPYLAYAVLIQAGLDGVRRGLIPPVPCNINLYTASDDILSRYAMLPATLEAAAACMQKSDFVQRLLPPRLIRTYCELAR
ncbi:MAG: glutamine synthetase family protein [Clostridia bacterium]|nr:glutamine synthetase family protein [Clostridia bacterium]